MEANASAQDAGQPWEEVVDTDMGSIDGVHMPDGFYWMGSGYMGPWGGVAAGHGAYADAEVPFGQNDTATSHACVQAWGALW